jgi:sucrose-6-phosphate hydrolase SacC (GH32 family)
MESKKETKENLSVNEGENVSKQTPKKITKENDTREDSFLKIKQKANETIQSSFDFAADASQKIDKNIKEGIQKAKEISVVQEVQAKADHLRTMDQKEKNRYKRKAVRVFVKVRDIIFGLFEKFVGKMRIGTQYGKSSLDLLSDLAKLKELGIITEKEFEAKKKEILDRI